MYFCIIIKFRLLPETYIIIAGARCQSMASLCSEGTTCNESSLGVSLVPYHATVPSRINVLLGPQQTHLLAQHGKRRRTMTQW